MQTPFQGPILSLTPVLPPLQSFPFFPSFPSPTNVLRWFPPGGLCPCCSLWGMLFPQILLISQVTAEVSPPSAACGVLQHFSLFYILDCSYLMLSCSCTIFAYLAAAFLLPHWKVSRDHGGRVHQTPSTQVTPGT